MYVFIYYVLLSVSSPIRLPATSVTGCRLTRLLVPFPRSSLHSLQRASSKNLFVREQLITSGANSLSGFSALELFKHDNYGERRHSGNGLILEGLLTNTTLLQKTQLSGLMMMNHLG